MGDFRSLSTDFRVKREMLGLRISERKRLIDLDSSS